MEDTSKYFEILKRQSPIIPKEKQIQIKESSIAIVGCGGIGGAAIEMLARMGIGKLILIDLDKFELSNLNRQVMSSLKDLNCSKAEVAKNRVEQINPYVKVIAYNKKLTETNVNKLLKDSAIIIDALDNILTRVVISRYAKNNKKPFISGAIHGTMGQITVFKENIDYETLFTLPSKNKDLNYEVKKILEEMTINTPPAIGPTPNIIGALEAMEALKIITKIGTVIEAPKILNFDLLDPTSFSIEEI